MTASVTIGYATTEARPTRITRTTPDGSLRTVRVRPGRANMRRQAINESRGNR